MIEEVKVWYRDTHEMAVTNKFDVDKLCKSDYETFKCRGRKHDGNLLKFQIVDGEVFININVIRKIEITKVKEVKDDCSFLRE